ncbi:hypothetical protein [Streptacidiphilus sp. MAP5-52]|uniref:hypothetical protein n=1 Tax=Streptacidiphilus sp. MAP5-52 TaxID=3156267 RepID=UPI003513754E
MPLPAFLHVTVGHRMDLDLLVASAPDRESAQWLRQAGFVRDDALSLFRPRQGTPAHVAEHQLRDACHLLTNHGFGVTRVYSEAEQRARITRPEQQPEGPPLTAAGYAARDGYLVADIEAGHLVMLAHHQSPYSIEFLGRYTADGYGTVGYTEGLLYYDLARFPDLTAASDAWVALGYTTAPPATPAPRSRAAQAGTRTAPSPVQAPVAPSARSSAPAVPRRRL